MPKRWVATLIALTALSAALLSLLSTVTVSGSAEVAGHVPRVAPATCVELVSDGGFEARGVGWTQSSTGGYNLISDFQSHTGSWGAYLGGTNNADDRLSQQIVLPSNAMSVSLLIWWSIATEEPGIGFDRMTVSVLQPNGALLRDLFIVDSSSAVNQWDLAEADLTQYAGQTIVLRFRATTNASNLTDFYVDDISMISCSSAVTSTVTPPVSASPSPTGTPRVKIYLPIIIRKGV